MTANATYDSPAPPRGPLPDYFDIDFGATESVSRIDNFWPGMSVHQFSVHDEKRVDFAFRSNKHTLNFIERGTRSAGRSWASGLSQSEQHDMREKLHYIPPNCEWGSWSVSRAPFHFTLVCLDEALIAETQCESGSSAAKACLFFREQHILTTIGKIKHVLGSCTRDTAAYGQALATLLGIEVAQWSVYRRSNTQKTFKGGLSGHQIKKINSFIEENFLRGLTLQELSAEINVSPQHFCRAFKETFNTTPLQSLIDKRINYAKDLLKDNNISITEIGIQAGFGGSSHFADTFKKHVGMTAREYRRLAC